MGTYVEDREGNRYVIVGFDGGYAVCVNAAREIVLMKLSHLTVVGNDGSWVIPDPVK